MISKTELDGRTKARREASDKSKKQHASNVNRAHNFLGDLSLILVARGRKVSEIVTGNSSRFTTASGFTTIESVDGVGIYLAFSDSQLNSPYVNEKMTLKYDARLRNTSYQHLAAGTIRYKEPKKGFDIVIVADNIEKYLDYRKNLLENLEAANRRFVLSTGRAQKLKNKTDPYSIQVRGTHRPGEVSVSLDVTLSPKEAKKLLKVIRPFAKAAAKNECSEEK